MNLIRSRCSKGQSRCRHGDSSAARRKRCLRIRWRSRRRWRSTRWSTMSFGDGGWRVDVDLDRFIGWWEQKNRPTLKPDQSSQLLLRVTSFIVLLQTNICGVQQMLALCLENILVLLGVVIVVAPIGVNLWRSRTNSECCMLPSGYCMMINRVVLM